MNYHVLPEPVFREYIYKEGRKMAGLIEKLHKIGDVINTVARVALGVTSIALCIAVIGQFILRWFGATMPWATEFSCYIFVWTTMLGSAVASRHLLHIGVDMVINLCHGKHVSLCWFWRM